MMSEMDVNAIAGTLKLYFRELPEPLFTDELYPNFAGGIGQLLYFYLPNNPLLITYLMLIVILKIFPNLYKSFRSESVLISVCLCVALSDSVAKESCMLNLLLSLPEPNLVTFLFLLDHLKR